ncbi:hypothetical protein Tco_0556580 [Tanacetum coccineum]
MRSYFFVPSGVDIHDTSCPVDYPDGTLFGGVVAVLRDGASVSIVVSGGAKVMAILVIPISSDSSEESVGMSTARVILFGTIPTSISATVPIVDPLIVHDDTPLIPTKTPTISRVVVHRYAVSSLMDTAYRMSE